MEKIIILIGFSLVFVINQGQAQRHITGTTHLEVQAGAVDNLTPDHYYGALHYYHQASRKFFWRAGIEASRSRIQVPSVVPAITSVPVESYLLKGSYFYTVMSLLNSSLYLNVGLSPLVGYEQINEGKSQINEAVSLQTKSPWVAGGQADVQVEVFLNSRWVCSINYGRRYLHGSSLGHWDDTLGLGLKFELH